jgi:hypothetical protein
MKRILCGVIFLFICARNVKADDHVCLAAGQVDMDISPLVETVTGYIGTTEVRLSHFQNKIYGTFQGMDVNLEIYGWRAFGTIGKNKVSWGFAKGHIHGFERCLF